MGVPISNVTRRVVYEASGTGPYSFSFEILANTDIAVYKDDALLTLTTDYTVTINANGTGSITLTASPTGADQIAIVGNRTIQRTTDFVTGGDFFANTVNDEMDQQTIFAQQNAEGLGRALQAPQTDPTTIDMTLPRASVRAGKVLAFDSNGDPTTGEVIGDFRGNWTLGTAYNKRDIVKDTSNSNIYYCNTAHTASGSQPISTNADSAKWTLIIDAEAASDAQEAAEAAQAAAETAETNAETAETNAETAATAAASSASAASTSASAASTSATNAASSASTASTAATNAGNSATAAASSASSASSSASSASTSATNAASSASSASTSASNASTSATNAASSASSASTSASNASTSATNASNSATAAATSATNAGNSATAAASSASAAATSETNAAASAASAASALDSFDDRYLGSKSSDPTVDNDGNALLTGALYYNTTTQTMKVYDGANWITATAAGTTALLTYKYLATAGQTTFSGAASVGGTLSYTSNNIIVFVNGVSLDSTDYTATNGTSVVLASGAALNDEVVIVAFKSFTVADTYTKGEVDAFAVKLTGNQTVAGVKTFSSDVVSNGLTVGKGAGSVSTNTAVGASALSSNTTGASNTVVGSSAGYSNADGTSLTAVGLEAGYSNTSGSNNVFMGRQAGKYTTTSSDNTGIGTAALTANTTGASNTAVGRQALQANTTADSNTAVGYQAMYSNTIATNNTAFGYQSLYAYNKTADTTGRNAAFGYHSLKNLTTGQENAAFGTFAGFTLTTGGSNLFVGEEAGYYATTGTLNCFVGYAAGNNVTTGSKNTILGRYSGNQGGLDIRTASNYIVLSDGDGLPRMHFNGSGYPFLSYARANAGSYALKFTSSAEVVFDTSSARYKENIRDSSYGLAAIMLLKSRMFEYKSEPDRTDIGLIAEEVNEVIPELVTLNKDGLPDAVSYDRFVSVCIKAIQELKAEFDAYKEAHP